MKKVVLDTNVLVSAFLSETGVPNQVLIQAGITYQLFISYDILEEVERVLSRPKIQKRVQLLGGEIRVFLAAIQGVADVVENPTPLRVIEDDPDDDLILGCAVGAKADYLVSGDAHLRKLGDYAGIRIVSPSEFLKVLQEWE